MLKVKKQGYKVIVFVLLLIFCYFLLIDNVFANENEPVSELYHQQQEKKSPADEGTAEQGASSSQAHELPSLFFLFLRTVLVLSIIVALLYILAKYLSSRKLVTSRDRFLQVISGVNLAPNKSLRLVKVGSVYYLLGVGENVQIIKEFSTEEEINEIEGFFQQENDHLLSSSKQIWTDFRAFFRKKERRENSSFQHQLEDRLSQLKGNLMEDQSLEEGAVQHRKGDFDQ